MTHITDQKFLSKRVISAFVELKDGFFNRLVYCATLEVSIMGWRT